MILKFRVSEQTINALNTKSVPRIGSKDYLVFQFSFSNDWEGLTKTAYLQRDSVSVPIEIKDGLVEVPEWFTEQESFNVTIFGTDGTKEVPTNVVAVKLEKSNDLWVKDAPEPTPSWITELIDLSNHPPIPGSNGFWLLWDPDADEYVESQLPLPEATTGGTSDHDKLKNRNAADQHPISAITGLEGALAGKQPTGNYLTKEVDPTVPDWAKQPQKPAYTAAEVNAEPSGAVAQHNVSDVAHNDIRLLIQGLSDRLSALADSDDATLDQMSEIVAYIKSNRELISSITTSKVSVTDIVNDLTTNVANKPLSAAQGVALKALIDALTKAIPEPYILPVASETTLGGVKPVAKTDEMTQPCGVDAAGGLWTKAGGGGGGTSKMQETVLASGVVASGTAQWHSEDTGLTVADLQEWKVWGFVSVSNTQAVTRGIGFGSVKPIYFGGAKKCSAVCSWFDDDRKAVQVIKAISGDGYIGVGSNFFNNSNRIFSASNLVAQGSAIPYVTNETDKVYFCTHEALTEDASFKIVGLVK